ncbi:dihydroorotate dehydrogenase B (NAD(+)), catalytic subunit [Clostridia bacterium]|nr:dihydroorotate dehydrogenase B (NAD(+)), catalytic subunit [Clostridia bacterium]
MVDDMFLTRQSVRLNNIRLINPIMPASGTFGFGREAAELYDLNLLGAVVLKGVTREPRYGNPLPRITDCPAGMLNSVGLENPGVDRVMLEEMPRLRKQYSGVIVANISGFSVEEYVYIAERFDQTSADILEINISCPNVRHGGMAFGTDAASAAQVVSAVRRATGKPIFIKLSPNVTDIVSIAKACEDAGADGLTLINTLLGMRVDIKTKRPILANTFGGLSGPAILPIALRMVYQVFEAVKIPIIGAGGIGSARDVCEMMLAGASAVQVGAAMLVEPMLLIDIIRDLPGVLDEIKADNVQNIIGLAHIE